MDLEHGRSRDSHLDDSPVAAGQSVDPEFEDLPLPKGSRKTNFEDLYSLRLQDNTTESNRSLPYQSIYSTSRENNVKPNFVVLPVNNITLKIVSYERSTSTLIRANPNLYVIEVNNASSKWILRRRFKHFQHLHNQLQLLRTSMNIPFPSRIHREQRASFRVELHKSKTVRHSLPRFPLLPEALVPLDQMEQRMNQLENYMKAVLENGIYRNYSETLSFLEISRMSFIDQLGEKRKEGWIKKKNGTNSSTICKVRCREENGEYLCCCCIMCGHRMGISGIWRQKWIFVKDSFFGYLRPDTNEIGCILLMDQDFKIATGIEETGLKHGLIVSNSSRQLFLKSWTKREVKEWADCIQRVMESTGRDFVQLEGANRFRSFVPIRKKAKCSWFVDGAGYMSAVADALEDAKEDIMIADWWLSPEIYMKRPAVDGNKWRLDTILRRKAEEGVRVFVLLYKEVEMALGINSLYSKKALSAMHPNIKVLRHPDHIAGTGTLLWAHHEKLVIVDQTLAFVSGIDLCYGRWDDQQHRLTDLGSVGTSERSMGVSNVTSSHNVGQQKPGVLFHLAKSANDVTLGTVIISATNGKKETKTKRKSSSEKSEQSTSHHLKMKHFTFRRKARLDSIEEETKDGKISGEYRGMNTQNASGTVAHSSITDVLEGSTKLWIGKDYTNFIVKDFDKLDQPLKDSVDRTTTPRMPWHDIGCAVVGEAARDVARHFVQRWNATKAEKVHKNSNFPYLVPKSYGEFDPYLSIKNSPTSLVDCQVLRSSTTWSVGSRITEDSILSAYIHAIQNAEHFIYIENQFFITACNSGEVNNRIGRALYDRIILASEKKSRFRVIVILPLLPGFEGQIGTSSGRAMQAIMHWNYASICRGNNSLLVKLRAANLDPLAYISFYGLRTHSQLNKHLVTELIYVHSKLMIVDDKKVICGSANINDRSLLGKRDSEMALLIEDKSFVESVMDGKPYRAGRFALSLRKKLFREHLGLLKPECDCDVVVDDPISDSFYKDTWIQTAALNTKIYGEVFHCIPCDEVTSFEELREYQSVLPLSLTEPSIAQQKLQKIKGHLVMLPLSFMSQEDLSPAAGTAEALLPTSLWT
ncbi:phospholipase D1 isoform X1 [Daphnia magna]|uniref:Phospholipase n=2 Tax=Daphnia magna TaxID=35525 RepID=A0ABQ9ZHU6_9CRUS|nr:phospholipase D1 isoform X1 [Daphnia magna]XP_045028959.1 phospholipase D1 isoform X1 [Daphnia magna]XP_045028960.1 phospholipase D1 isoform X1 [Daphnia magna]XP_045028961.1 phospholipase D1 isoform X1 [Daphnia magna]KAK4012263.1 hypothetical protein OUZ56_021364 [Daphnia magna]